MPNERSRSLPNTQFSVTQWTHISVNVEEEAVEVSGHPARRRQLSPYAHRVQRAAERFI